MCVCVCVCVCVCACVCVCVRVCVCVCVCVCALTYRVCQHKPFSWWHLYTENESSEPMQLVAL